MIWLRGIQVISLQALILLICSPLFFIVSKCSLNAEVIPFRENGINFSPERIAERINSHIIIGDTSSACSEAAFGLQQYPKSKELWKAYIRALAKSGNEKAMANAWQSYGEIYSEEKYDKEILESMAWAILEKGYASSSPMIRAIAILGAFFSQDAKGVAILLQGLSDENSFVRGASVKLSSELHDASLQEKLLVMLKQEHVWSVRVQVINSLGKLKVLTSKKSLEKIIASADCHAEEKAAAIKALVSLTDSVDAEQLKKLSLSDRAGFRMLACEYIGFFNQTECIPLLFPLLKDHHASVRAIAMQTLGRFPASVLSQVQDCSITAFASQGICDKDMDVAIIAAYVLTIHSPQEGMLAFQQLLGAPLREIRHQAAAALAATGKYGLSLTKKVFRENGDIYMKMNLALGLIGQREELTGACDCLYTGLKIKEQWAFADVLDIRYLSQSKVKHDDATPNQPEAVNLVTRLEILQVLSIVHYPKAQEAIKDFLKESTSGITGLASALLLTEGDDEAVDLVRKLLNDSDKKVRVQAALILSLWGEGEEVAGLLQDAYLTSDREEKAQILEGVGRAKATSSLAFLADKLQEPYQTLRIVAAAALLECLYH